MLWLILSSSLLLLWYANPLIAKGAKATYNLVSKLKLPKIPKPPINMAWLVERLLLSAFVVACTLYVTGYQPKPAPPGPGPKPIIVVPPVPDIDGPRTVVIVRESEDDDPDFQGMSVNLRFGDHAKVLEAGGHQLITLDDDEVDEDGQPVPLLKNLLPLNPRLPALFILDDKANVLYHETITELTADHVIKVLQDHD